MPEQPSQEVRGHCAARWALVFRTVLRAYADLGSDQGLRAYCADHNATPNDVESLGDACFKEFEDLVVTKQLEGVNMNQLRETLHRRKYYWQMAITRNKDPTMGEFDIPESEPYRWHARPQTFYSVTDSVLSMGKWKGQAGT